MDKPYISIVISVYNGEKTISRCLQSLVYQTLEQIEIIVVNKASKDGTLAIARQYEAIFPQKVKVYDRPYSINMAAGLTYGISMASAEYVTVCDADDWFDLNAMETVWKVIEEEPVDLVSYGWRFLREDGTEIRKARHPNEESVQAQILSAQMCTYWSRVWRKSLFEGYLPIPEVAGCDANFLLAVIQEAKTIRNIPNILYNYMAGTGTSHQRVSTEWLTLMDGWNYLLEHAKEPYKNCITAAIARRVSGVVNKYWLYRIEYVKWLKCHRELFEENPLLKQETKLYQYIMKLIEEEREYIPLNVFLSGFGKSREEVQGKIDALNALPLSAGTGHIYVLDESTVDLEQRPELKSALAEGYHEYVGHRCALEHIEEMGGIYVGDHLVFRATFEPVLHNESFFSFITTDTFSEQIWGAKAHNPVIRTLLRTYDNKTFYPEKYLPLAERIRNILVSEYDIPLNGRGIRKEKVVVYDARMLVLNRMDGAFVCEHDMSHLWNQAHYTVIPDDLALPTEIGSQTEVRKLKQEVERYKNELRGIYHSDSWKLIGRLKRMSNTALGKQMKKIFKWFLRKYRRYKYGI